MSRIVKVRERIDSVILSSETKRLAETCILIYEYIENQPRLEFSDLITAANNIKILYSFYLDMPSITKNHLQAKIFVIDTIDQYALPMNIQGIQVWDEYKYNCAIRPVLEILNGLNLK
jgi:hypothetical protein